MISKKENERQKVLSEHINVMHILCIVVYVLSITLSDNLYSQSNFIILNKHFVVMVSFLGLTTTLVYNKNIKNLKVRNLAFYITYILLPLIISVTILFVFLDGIYYREIVLFIPILVVASMLGKLYGLVIATICSMILIIYRAYIEGNELIHSVESALILISLMYIIGWFIGGLTNIENEYRRDLIRMANTDMLTGLYNHRYFQERLIEELLHVSKKAPISLLLIDIDYFKHYNDSFGHQRGDEVLRIFGEILLRSVGVKGFAARYGGEEFVVVLPQCDSNRALEVAELIRNNIANQTFEGEEHQPGGKLTISCGIATCPTHANNAKDLIKYADMALYRAKSLKKNKVELYFSVFDELEVNENEKELVNSIRMLVTVINAKDRYTYGHSERVTDYALQLAESIGLAEEEKRLLNYSAFLHDIGKIEIDRDILNSARRLTNEEFEILKQHPSWGSDIVKAVKKLQPAAEIILYHHENYDGSGYPSQLKGEEIPLLARIIRIADSYDAMTSNRPYKRNMSSFEALEELERCSGSMFDPELTKKFISIISAD